MEHFNLIKSFTTLVNNITSLPSREGLGLGLGKVRMGLRMLILCLALATFGVNDAWGDDTYYYAKLSVKSSTGHGKVYVEDQSTTNSTPATKTKMSEKNTKSVSFTIKADVVSGYSFKWGDNNTDNPRTISVNTSSEDQNKPQDGGTYDGQYTANINTKYIVKHYQQNVDGSYPANATETDNLTGTTDTKVIPARKSYTGFTAPDGQELTIMGDGSASVSYNYTRNSYTLTWNLDGGTITTSGTPAGQVKYGATLSAPVPSKAGAQFNGWSPSVPATMPAEDVAFTAQWVSKYDFEMSGEDRSMKVDEELPNAFTFTHADNPVAHILNTDVVTYDAANNKLIAHQEGTTTIYFTQSATSTIQAGTSDTYNITVTKIANTLAVEDTHTMKIGETWTSVCSGINSDAELSVNNTHGEIATFDLATNTITAHQAGTTTITFTQEATYKYTAKEVSVDVTVNKKDNGFVWNVSSSYNWNQEIKNPFTSNNPNPITCVSDNKNIADYIDGVIYIYNVNGSATFTINQDATDIYNGINEKRNVTVTKANNHVGISISNNNYSLFEVGKSADVSWTNNGYQLSDNGWSAQTDYVIIHFEGVPNKLSFVRTLSTTLGQLPGTYECKVFQSSNGSDWLDCWSLNQRSETENVSNVQLLPTTQYLKFQYNGTLYCYYSNITITERREVKAHSDPIIDFGECVKTDEVKQKTTYIDWYNVRPLTVSITGTDADQFEAVTTSIESSLDNYQENVPVVVKYKHTTAGTHTANLVVSNGIESATITLNGTSKKQDPVITWKDNLSPLQVNEVVSNPASAGAAVVKYESSDEYFLTVDNTNHTITAVNPTQEGGITLKAYVKGDETWNYAEITCTIEITNLQRQIITWTDKLSRKFTETEVVTLTASSDAGLPITYSLSGEGTYASLSGSQLTITGIGDGLYVTASQAGDETYYPAAMTKHLVVRDPSAACGKVLLAEDYAEHTLTTGITSVYGEWAELSWNPANGEPGLLSCEIKKGSALALGKMRAEEYYDGDWHEIQSYDVTTSYATKSNIPIQRKSTKVRVGAPTGCTLSHYVKNIEVTQAKYAELSIESIDFGDVSVATQQQRQFTIHYSNLNNSLELALDNEDTQFSVDKELIGEDCGEFGTDTVTVTYNAGVIRENETCTLTIKNSEYYKTIALKANVTKTSQTITWNPATTDLLTTDSVQFDATTSASTMELNVTYSIPEEQQSIATIDASTGQLTIYTAGEVTVTVSQEGSDLISPAVPVSKTFTITREIPTITTLPTVTTSVRPATLADLTLQGGEASVEGTFTWKSSDKPIQEGDHTYWVVFTPSNTDWYSSTEVEIHVVLSSKAQYIDWNTQPMYIYCGQILELDAVSKANSDNLETGLTINYRVDNTALATVEGNILTTLKPGTLTITAQQQGDLAYVAAEELQKVIYIQPNVFNGTGDWNDGSNWSAGVSPTDDQPTVSIAGSLIIDNDNEVTAGVLTIESTGTVTIADGGVLTIEGTSAARETYGDLTVGNGGQLVLNASAQLDVRNVYISSSVATHSSGQVSGAEHLVNHGDVYFDWTPGANATNTQWHAFTVPFPVNVNTGIYDLDGNKLRAEYHYAVMSYHSDIRANGQYGWKKCYNWNGGILQPGDFYIMATDGDHATYRFKMLAGSSIATPNSKDIIAYSGTGDVSDQGWNAVGNPTLMYGKVDYVVQVLDPTSYTYRTCQANECNFTVGTPFAIQAATDGSMTMLTADAEETYAPARLMDINTIVANCKLFFSNATFSDQLLVSASEEASNTYEIGKDLVKMTMTATPAVPQIFAHDYSVKLCAINTPMTNNQAVVNLLLYAPAVGEYTISAQPMEGVTAYLTYNGTVIWNLSLSAYNLDLNKGDNAGYGVLLTYEAPQVVTDCDEVKANNQNAQKLIINNNLYILRDGLLYDATGKVIK